jgi:hypothetical protein
MIEFLLYSVIACANLIACLEAINILNVCIFSGTNEPKFPEVVSLAG